MNFYKIYSKNTFNVYNNFINNTDNLKIIKKFEKKINLIKSKNKFFIFGGNGGSFADAMHFSSEITGRLKNKKRPPLKSFVLGSNESSLTAIANDYSYEEVFKRELNPFKQNEFILILLSTSGKSKSILKILDSKNISNNNTYLFTGNKFDRKFKKINVFSFDTQNTSNIQECYKIFMHSCLIKNNF